VIPFNNEELVKKIHQTFRIQYLKDVVLPRVLDDATFASLNSLIFYNQLEIITALRNDKIFFQELFNRLKSTELTEANRKDLILFLVELCSLAKNLVPPNRTQFYK
jgi:protein phosphatase-4 regulatory subunit 3